MKTPVLVTIVIALLAIAILALYWVAHQVNINITLGRQPDVSAKMEPMQHRALKILVARAKQKSEDYRRITASIATIEGQVENLVQPCPTPDKREECRAYYLTSHEEIGHVLNGLTHEAPIVFGPSSGVGLAIDNAYSVRQIFRENWAAQDRRYAECLRHRKGQCGDIVDIRNSYLWPFSQCMLITSCLVGDQMRENDATLRTVAQFALEYGTRIEEEDTSSSQGHMLAEALDTLYSPAGLPKQQTATCPGVDLTTRIRSLCVDRRFKDEVEGSRKAMLCSDWRSLYHDEERFPAPTFCPAANEP